MQRRCTYINIYTGTCSCVNRNQKHALIPHCGSLRFAATCIDLQKCHIDLNWHENICMVLHQFASACIHGAPICIDFPTGVDCVYVWMGCESLHVCLLARHGYADCVFCIYLHSLEMQLLAFACICLYLLAFACSGYKWLTFADLGLQWFVRVCWMVTKRDRTGHNTTGGTTKNNQDKWYREEMIKPNWNGAVIGDMGMHGDTGWT